MYKNIVKYYIYSKVLLSVQSEDYLYSMCRCLGNCNYQYLFIIIYIYIYLYTMEDQLLEAGSLLIKFLRSIYK